LFRIKIKGIQVVVAIDADERLFDTEKHASVVELCRDQDRTRVISQSVLPYRRHEAIK
jgi:hypothetical protein